MLCKDRAGVHRSIQTLIRHGYVQSRTDHHNGDKTKIYITLTGETALNTMLDVVTQIDKELMSVLSIQEIAQFRRLLYKLISCLKAYPQI